MTTVTNKRTEVSGTKPEGPAAPPEQHRQAQESPGNGPLWKADSKRVQAALWKHDQKGKARYTVSISRSFKDQAGKWVNVHYFDKQDLDDVVAVANQAREQILSLEGIVYVVGED